jgi:hypothetical protein
MAFGKYTLETKQVFEVQTITQAEHMPGDSQFWSGLMKAKNDLLRMGEFIVGDDHKLDGCLAR